MTIIYRIVKILVRVETLLFDILMNLKRDNLQKIQPEQELLLNPDQVKEMLKISNSTLYRYKKQGILVPTALNGKYYRHSDVLRHIGENRKTEN